MIKTKGLWYAVKYYRIIQLLILAVSFLFADYYLLHLFAVNTDVIKQSSYYSTLYTMYCYIIAALAVILWLFTTITVYRKRTYYYRTNRNLARDRKKYDRSYHELTEYFQDADPHRLDTSNFPIQPWRQTKGILFGKSGDHLITIPSDSEGNIAVFGYPGSGKTTGFSIINAMCFEGSVLAIDIKGDIYNYVSEHTDRNIVRFSPDLEDSYGFDPLAEIDLNNTVQCKLYLETIANILVPDIAGSDGDYFTSTARNIFQGVAHLMLHENPETSFPDIVHGILQHNIFYWVKKSMDSDCIAAKENLDSIEGNAEKNITSAYNTLTAILKHFSNENLDKLLARNPKKNISVDTLEKGTDIYLHISQEYLDAYAPLFTLIIQTLSTGFTKRPDKSEGVKNRPILMILDEFPQLTFSYKLLNANLSTLRSKGVTCMLLSQSLSQMESKYEKSQAYSILGNCNYQVILGSNDANTSRDFSEMFGKRKILKVSNSLSDSENKTSSRTVQETEELIFPQNHFGDLPSKDTLVLYFKGKYIECEKLKCYKD